jgi:hypothetical protein
MFYSVMPYVTRKGAYRVLVEEPEGKRVLGRPRLDGRIILKWIFSKWNGDIECIDLSQNKDRWLAHVGKFLTR